MENEVNSVVIYPDKNDFKIYRSNLENLEIQKINKKEVFVLAFPELIPLICSLSENNKVFLVPTRYHDRCLYFSDNFVKTLNKNNKEIIEVDKRVYAILKSFTSKGVRNPVLSFIRKFNINAPNCKKLMSEIVDPRLHVRGNEALFSRAHLNRFLKFCGLTYRIFVDIETKIKDKNQYLSRALLALNCWYNPDEFKKLKSQERIGLVNPRPNPTDELSKIENYFWRMFYNFSKFKWDPIVVFKVTKRFAIMLFRVWGHYLKLKEFFPNRFFKYKCEAEFAKKELEKLDRNILVSLSN